VAETAGFTVGLEIHVRLNTPHKIFCYCPNRADGAPNTHTCPVCLGLPGTLPVLNPEVKEPALRLALALGCTIARVSEFSRKNYFYPDLPRNYQITQQRWPLATGGQLEEVGLERIHLEEDAGRSRHQDGGWNLVDLNRAGTPLAEIVTLPQLRDGAGARRVLARLRQLVRYLGISDGDMEKGSLRCDANVGLGPGHSQAGPWVEVKNLNSLRFVQKAVDQEIQRLGKALACGQPLRRQTRGWDPRTGQTYAQRLKEELADYLYFPEPDLPPLVISAAAIEAVRRNQPELPGARQARYEESWGLSRDDAATLCRTPQLADYFDTTVQELRTRGFREADGAAEAARWILSRVLAAVDGKDESLKVIPLQPSGLAALLAARLDGRRTRQQILTIWEPAMRGEDPVSLVEREVPPGPSREQIQTLAQQILARDAHLVARFQAGNPALLNHFLGNVMQATKGRAEPRTVKEILLELLAGFSP